MNKINIMNRSAKIKNTHPGELLFEEVIKANNLTVTEAANLLGISRPTLSNIVNEKSSITPFMALRIKTVFGGTADIWLKLQMQYDLRNAEKEFMAHPPKLMAYA